MSATTIEVDLTGFSRMNSQLLGALIGTGQGGIGDAQKLISAESATLAWEIQNQLGPKSKATAGKQVEKELHKALYAPKKFFTVFKRENQKEGEGIRWLTAGPNYLSFIKNENYQIDANAEQVLRLARARQKTAGTAWKSLGKIGHQYVVEVDKPMVRAAAFNQAKSLILKQFGKLKASFAFTARRLVSKKQISAIAEQHLTGSDIAQRAILDDSRLNTASPEIVFGSRSPGVVSNSKVNGVIISATKKRMGYLKTKAEKILKGYCYDWNTGAVFKPKDNIINN